MNFITGVRFGDLLAAALSIASFVIARVAFSPNAPGVYDEETGQLVIDTTRRSI
jgi:hypothetical protein